LGENLLKDFTGFRNELLPQLQLLDIKNNEFNCSYLQHFLEIVNWERLHLLVAPRSTKPLQPNIRGINCEIIGINKTTEPESNIPVRTISDLKSNSPERSHFIESSSRQDTIDSSQKYSDDIFMKVILFLIFVVISIFSIVFVIINRDRLFNSNQANNMENALSNRIVRYSNDELLLQ